MHFQVRVGVFNCQQILTKICLVVFCAEMLEIFTNVNRLTAINIMCFFHIVKLYTVKINFTITAEIHARSLANFYCQYADRHMNLKFMRRVSERELAIRQFVIVKNKLMSVFNASILLLTLNFVITLLK